MKHLPVVRFMPVLGLVLLACGSATASAQTAKNPITIVKTFVDGFNTGQLDKVMSVFAEDGLEVSPEGRFQGKDACRQYFKTLIDRGFRWDYTNYRETKGEVRSTTNGTLVRRS